MSLTNAFTHKFNLTPRLSASQVAEYLSANAAARRRIITEAKYPPIFLVARYDEARQALCEHLTKGRTSRDVLKEALEKLIRKAGTGGTEWTKGNYKLNLEAIGAFQAHENLRNLGDTRFHLPHIGQSKLSINGVTVSVSLDLMTEVARDNGKTNVGGAILCLWKTRTSDIPHRCQAMAMLASEVVSRYLKDGQQCDPKMCLAVDIFGGKVYRAKAHQKMLFKTVEISCGEVATIWPSVEPPAKYNGPPVAKAS